MKFTLEKAITLKTPCCVLMCQRAVLGDGDGCRYAVCESCNAKRMPKGCQKLACEKRKMRCHQEFHNLVDQYDLWWCKKKEINSLNWMERAQTCVFCGGMFVVGDEL